MQWLVEARDALESVTLLVQILGIPVAIWIFFTAKTRERRDRENGTYDALDTRYQEYLGICLSNPDLPLFASESVRAHGARLLTEQRLLVPTSGFTQEQEHRLQVAYCMLISILERAFLMYRDQTSSLRRKQWSGWEAYIEDWLRHPAFSNRWTFLKHQFDEDFVSFVNQLEVRIVRQSAMQLASPP